MIGKFINKNFRKFGVELRKVGKHEINTPMDSVNTARLLYFREMVKLTEGIEGEIVECGVGMGRSLASIMLIVKHLGDSRSVWGFDSFEGFPDPNEIDLTVARKPRKGDYSVSQESVNTFLKYAIDDESFHRSRLTLVKGFFENTLGKYPHEKISLLHLDVDIYDSYKVCLETMYPKLSTGGIVTFDEYLREANNFPGAAKAIDEFFLDKDVTFHRCKFYGKYYVIKQN